jgi:hypothetical protein
VTLELLILIKFLPMQSEVIKVLKTHLRDITIKI